MKAKFVWAALIVAVMSHFAFIHAAPRILTGVAIERLGEGGFNQWRLAPRVTEQSRAIVRPSPDFAYSVCAFDLSNGPITIQVAPWDGYWSLSLYAANSDNFYVANDREARAGADIVVSRRARREDDESTATFVRSPTSKGIALIRRLAPTPTAYAVAAQVARADVCAAVAN
jgi:uncharacterized membrane protein